MYDYNLSTTSSQVDENALMAFLAGLGILWVFIIAIVVLMIVGLWKMFQKAGKHGYESLIAGHNNYVMLEIGGLNTALYFLILIPFVGPIILEFMMNIAVSKTFGKGTGFGVLMTFFPYICYPILGFSNATYDKSLANK